MKRHILSLIVLIMFAFSAAGCATTDPNNTGEGAVLGGLLGATAGGIIGHQSHDTGAGLLIGAAAGAATGAIIGSQIPKEQEPVYVQQPVLIQRPVEVRPVPQSTYIVNVPNRDGTYTGVQITRGPNGFFGPQGEYYPSFPSTAQLTAMYEK